MSGCFFEGVFVVEVLGLEWWIGGVYGFEGGGVGFCVCLLVIVLLVVMFCFVYCDVWFYVFVGDGELVFDLELLI